MSSPYDSFAWFYHRYWAAPHQDWQVPALDKLLYPGLPAHASILDLCCGTGVLSKRMAALGYHVTGLDSSSEMLRIAREEVPHARFVLADVTAFHLEEPVDAVVSTFDSLNHILEPENLARAFRGVHAALKPGGRFVFDMNTPAAYGERWNQSASEIEQDAVFFLRGGYDPEARIGATFITMFRLFDHWERSDVLVRQRPWEVPEVVGMLEAAGFTGISAFRTTEDLGMDGTYGIGRVHIACESRCNPA